MKKLVVLVILMVSMHTVLFAAFKVKIGVYSNIKNLRGSIRKVSNTEYRKKITIIKKGNLYYAHAIFSTKNSARLALSSYKKVFNDAFISQIEVANREVKKKSIKQKKIEKIKKSKAKSNKVNKTKNKDNKLVLEKDNSSKTTTKKEKIEKVLKFEKKKDINITNVISIESNITEKVPRPLLSKHKSIQPLESKETRETTNSVAGKLFLNKTFYVCSTFRKDSKVLKIHFTPLYMQYAYNRQKLHKVNYRFEKSSIEMELMAMKVVHVVVQNSEDFILLDVMINGIMVDKLRYYYDENKANKYRTK